MKIAVEGCCHGELDKIYDTVSQLEIQNGFKIDLLIICGDFQAVRNLDDLQAMAVPPKYQKLNTFYKYYSGEKVAPILTIIIGGNHEASNYFQELPYGGWVAQNIYYLGYAGVVQVGGVRIGGISGIYKGFDFNKGHFETAPYDDSTKRSVYHVRNLEVFRLKQVSRHLDIFLSHDWPTGVYHYGDVPGLLRAKPFFKKEVEENTLGSKPCADLLSYLKPSYWFAAHLHVKFAAYIEHPQCDNTEEAKSTKFLALDKCLPRKRFLQILDIPHNIEEGLKIKLDAEWLKILQSTNHLLNTTRGTRYMPGPNGSERYDFSVTDSDMDDVKEVFGGDMTLPENFVATAPPFSGNPHNIRRHQASPLFMRVNPQTTLLCTMLEITDPNAKLLGKTSEELLNESGIGLQQKDEDDDAEDDEHDGIDEVDTTCNPSFNSSMELSQSSSFSSNISSSWDGLIGNRKELRETPSRANIQVADDDEELMSILSAQKSKSLPHPAMCTTKHSSPSPSSSVPTPLHRSATAPSSSTPVSQRSNCDNPTPDSCAKKSQKPSIADRLKSLNTKIGQSTSGDVSEIASNVVSTTNANTTVESCDSSKTSLTKSDTLDCYGADSRVEFESMCSNQSRDTQQSPDLLSDSLTGNKSAKDLSSTSSSGISSVSSSSSVIGSANVSPPLKRDSSDLDSTSGSQEDRSTVSSSGGSMKKLKRRNVSMYQEDGE